MQLKRNKEMEFETLKKSHKKGIIIGVLAVCVIGGALTFATTRAKYELTQDLELVKGTINYKLYDFKVMAMYKSDDGTNYTEITDRMLEDYVINEEKSYCTIDNINHDNEVELYTKNGEHLFKNLKKSDKCYIYFDKYRNEQTVLGTLKVNYSKPDFNQIATTDEGIFGVYDEVYDGYSYYWRGAATTNHVIFANKCWRIIRVNGDGSIRIIYNGTVQTGNICAGNGYNEGSIAIRSVRYNTVNGNSAFVGYTYTEGLQRPSNNSNGISSNLKVQTEEWYNSNIGNSEEYASKVVEGKYCNDRNTAFNENWNVNGTNFYFAAYERRALRTPSLNCQDKDVYRLKAGAITADEVMFAGAVNVSYNDSYYLYSGLSYWTMSPFYWNGSGNFATMFYVSLYGHLNSYSITNSEQGIRPVINLSSDVTISDGNGTQSNPYVVE